MSITFPPQSAWVPDEGHYLFSTAAGLLAVAGGVLDYYGRGQSYERRMVYHGAGPPPVAPGEPQIAVSIPQLNIGNAGEEQFGFAKGDYGKMSQRTVEYMVQVANDWPVPEGGITTSLPQVQEIMEAADLVFTDGFLIYNALLALSLGGVQTDLPISLIPQNQMLVGQMKPLDPHGGMAGWLIPFFVQF